MTFSFVMADLPYFVMADLIGHLSLQNYIKYSGNAAFSEGFAISARGIFTKSRSAMSGCGTCRSSQSMRSLP